MQKAISAIIATIMLLVITTSLIGVFYVFSSTLTTTTTSSGSEQVSQLTKQLTYCMQIRNIYKNQVTLENCGKEVIENKSLTVTMDDVKLGASTTTINEGESGIVNVSVLWQIAPGKRNLKISNGAAFALALVDVQPNKDGLVGRWDFNEGSGTTANDGSGNNNIGTLLPSGSEPIWVNGKFNKGLQFDGANDYVDAGNASSLNFGATDSFSLSVWIKTGSTARQYVYSKNKNNALYDGYYIDVSTDGTGRFIIDSGFPSSDINTGISVVDNKWHLITGIVDRSTNIMYIFLDGVQKSSADISSVGSLSNIDNVFIGILRSDGFHYYPFNGTIDEVRIWNKALAPDDTIVMKQII